MICREEFTFQHNSNKRIADVVLLDDDNINFIFEIFKSNKTDEINRPSDKWCEINANDLIIKTMEETNINDCGEIEIECVRNILCDECKIKHNIKYEAKQKKKQQEKLIADEVKRIERDKDKKMWDEWEEKNRYKYDENFKKLDVMV